MKSELEQQLNHNLMYAQWLCNTWSLDQFKHSITYNSLNPYNLEIYKEGLQIPANLYALVLESRVLSMRSKNKSLEYDPMIFSGYNNTLFINKLLSLASQKVTKRFDVIIMNEIGMHATPFSFLVQPDEVKCVFMDFSRDQRNTNVIARWIELSANQNVTFFASGFQTQDRDMTLQKDRVSCLPLAEAILHKMHRIPYEDLERVISNANNDYLKLPAFLMKYAQSINMIREYRASNPETTLGLSKKYDFEELRAMYYKGTIIECYEDLSGKKSEKFITQNRAVDFLKLRSLQKALGINEKEDVIEKRLNNLQRFF